MEQGEPALVPQWYKIANGSTSTNGLRTSSSKRFDENVAGLSPRNRLLEDQERNLRRSLSSNGSVVREKGRQVESWAKKHGSSGNNSSPSRGSTIASIGKTSFDKEFPSLRVEGKQGFSDAAVVSPLGLRTAVQSLPTGTPVIIGTSALAQVPVKVETDGSINSPVLQASTVNHASTPGSSMPGLNMAEALAQAPSQVSDTPQLLINSQRIEELTLRKCKQLIPMTPSLPKALNGNLSDKAKSKVARGGDFTSLVKAGQLLHVNQTIRSPTNSDVAKTSSVGNFQVLNREKNGITSIAKDGQGLSKVVNPVGPMLSSAVLPSKISTDQNVNIDKNTGDRKILSQAQNRNAFFNLLRKKSSNSSSTISVPSSLEPPLSAEKSNGEQQHSTFPVNMMKNSLPSVSDGFDEPTDIGSMNLDFCASDQSERSFADDNVETNPNSDNVVDPEEEAFLRSLGWDKNGWEEALTAEEIDDFRKKYEKQRPLKIVPEYIDGSNSSGAET
ncbi:uncharacterized protein LOC141846772 isoform X2 [Curcuma longa]|uniref:uncharacterized protein LOC141846772 isoform X2 n=1 Tax=Curcuma longa TaxID=136217 RepID=UPI003D9E688C